MQFSNVIMMDEQHVKPASDMTEDGEVAHKSLYTKLYADHVAESTLAEVEKLTCVLTGKPVRDLVRDFVIAKIGSDVPHEERKTDHKHSRHKSSKHKKKKKKSKLNYKEKSVEHRQSCNDKVVDANLPLLHYGSSEHIEKNCCSSKLVSNSMSAAKSDDCKGKHLMSLPRILINHDKVTVSGMREIAADQKEGDSSHISVVSEDTSCTVHIESDKLPGASTDSVVESGRAVFIGPSKTHSFEHESASVQPVSKKVSVEKVTKEVGNTKNTSSTLPSETKTDKHEEKTSSESKSKRDKQSREKKGSRSSSRHKSPRKRHGRSRSKERKYREKPNTSSKEKLVVNLSDECRNSDNKKEIMVVVKNELRKKVIEPSRRKDEIKTLEKEIRQTLSRADGRDDQGGKKSSKNEQKDTDLEIQTVKTSSSQQRSSRSSRHSTREKSHDDTNSKNEKCKPTNSRESSRVCDRKREQDIPSSIRTTEDGYSKKRQIRCSKQHQGYHGSDDETTDDVDSPTPRQRARLEVRSLKESSVIQVSDDDADVISDHMMEKLHKRLTTSLKKSKELQAEMEMGLSFGSHLVSKQTMNNTVIDLESCELPEYALGLQVVDHKKVTDVVCLDCVDITSSVPDIPMPASSLHPALCNVSQVASVDEAVKVNCGKAPSKPAALGKKFGLKFGLKISESSAALISLGVKGDTKTVQSLQASSKPNSRGTEADIIFPSLQSAPESEGSSCSDETIDKSLNQSSWMKSCETRGEVHHWYRESESSSNLPTSVTATVGDQLEHDCKLETDSQSGRNDKLLAAVASDNFSTESKLNNRCISVSEDVNQCEENKVNSTDSKSKIMKADAVKEGEATSCSSVENQLRSQKSHGSRKRSRSRTRRSGSRNRKRSSSRTRRSVSPKYKSRTSRSPRKKPGYNASNFKCTDSKIPKSSRRSRSTDSLSRSERSEAQRSKRSGSKNNKSRKSRSRSETPVLKKRSPKRSGSSTRRPSSHNTRLNRSGSRSVKLDSRKSRSSRSRSRTRRSGSRNLGSKRSRSRRSGSRKSKLRRSSSRTDRSERTFARNVRSDSRRSQGQRSRSRGRRSGSRQSQTRRLRSRSRDSRNRKSRSSSGDARHKSPTSSRLNIDKQKLREIAIKTVYAASMQGSITPTVELKPTEVVAIKSGGKSVKELTEFCQKIADQESKGGSKVSVSRSEKHSAEEEDEDASTVFSSNGLKALTSSSIVMNIRNAKQLPVLTAQEKAVKAVVLRTQFPVSSGTDHRTKESEWVPVVKNDPAGTNNTDKVFVEAPSNPDEVASLVDERQNALRKLKVNPHNKEALGTVFKVQQQIKQWSEVDNLQPGQFMGSTGVQTLTPHELGNDNPRFQAWVKKDTFTRAAPVTDGIGKLLMEKMGWKAGNGLGKNNEGIKVPIPVEIKTDRKGLISHGEHQRPLGHSSASNDLSAKHPVSALNELCSKRRWPLPVFSLVDDAVVPHNNHYLFKVVVNQVEYRPAVGNPQKKLAKIQAAQLCLQELGVLPKT